MMNPTVSNGMKSCMNRGVTIHLLVHIKKYTEALLGS